jgi:hypothetical protein
MEFSLTKEQERCRENIIWLLDQNKAVLQRKIIGRRLGL